jgi:hypothetical protein
MAVAGDMAFHIPYAEKPLAQSALPDNYYQCYDTYELILPPYLLHG